eukprot:COSAG02_NODE_186_length_30414_cov_24.815372_24_plen_72_part_01
MDVGCWTCTRLKRRHTSASVRAPTLIRNLVQELLLRNSSDINILAPVSQLLFANLTNALVAVALRAAHIGLR